MFNAEFKAESIRLIAKRRAVHSMGQRNCLSCRPLLGVTWHRGRPG